MSRLSPTELTAFLQEPHLCRLGCVDEGGYPYVVPCWFHYADGGFYLVPRARSAWASYLQQDPRVFLCIDAENGRRVLVKGKAQLLEAPNLGGRWLAIAREMALRYQGQAGLQYLETTSNEPRWLFFVAPEQMLSSRGGWAKRYKHSDWIM